MDIITLTEVEGEPRALDLDIAARLGMARPTNIRQLIEKNRKELEGFGMLHASSATSEMPNGGVKVVTEYRLNEEQALTVAQISRAPNAKEVRGMLVKVFVAWRRGQLIGRPGGDYERVTAQEKALARVLEILEQKAFPGPIELPQGTTLVRQHPRRVSIEREKAVRLSAALERLERILASDAPPMIPPPDMDRHMIYRAGICLVLVDTADWRLGRGEKAFVLHDGRMMAAIMHGAGNQDGSLWSRDRTGWAFIHEFPNGIAEPALCQVKVLGRLIKTVPDLNYGRSAA